MPPPGQLTVNTETMLLTAQQTTNKADSMLNHAITMRAGIQFASENWRGPAGDAWRAATAGLDTVLTRLIEKLRVVSDAVKMGGQGFEVQEADATAALQKGHGIVEGLKA